MTITINEKDIELKYTLRSMMMYENITGKTFAPEGVSDILTFFYCVVVASARNYDLKFDDFLDVIDENQDKLNEFSLWLTNVVATQNFLKKTNRTTRRW